MSDSGKFRFFSRGGAAVIRRAIGRGAFRRWTRLALALTALLSAHAASPWRFWGKADGLGESVVFELIADDTGRVIIKGREVPLGVLDGYRITNMPTSRGYGRLLPASQQELWTFDTKGINVHDASGWRLCPDKDIAEFTRTRPMSRFSWFVSLFRGPEDQMDLVPFGKDTGFIMFPDGLLERNRITGRKRLLRIAGDPALRRFRDIRGSRDGGLWLTGGAGLAHRDNAAGAYGWREFPGQLTAARSIGCDVVQGYLLSRQVRSREAESLLNSKEGLAGQLRAFGDALQTKRERRSPDAVAGMVRYVA